MPEKLLWERSITCNLEKPKLVWGLWIEPWNPFARKIRIRNSGKDSNQKGKMSFKLLFPRFRTSSILQFTNDGGIFPFIWLRLKSSVFKLLPFVNVPGNFPWKLLFLIFNTERELLKSPKQCGIWPINFLLDRSRTWRAFSMQIIGGILPVKLLFEAKKYFVDNGGIGSKPWNKLELKSKCFKFWDEEIFWNLRGPVNWFWDRSRSVKEVIVNKDDGMVPVSELELK